jgi:sulfoxide reductase heme-binding subunit YedZ
MSHTWWYATRAAGIVAWALIAITLLGGLQLSTRLVRRPAPAWVLDVHRFVAGLAVALVGVHLVALVLDPFVKFGIAELLVPFASSYKPGAVSLGIAALYLLLAVELTSLAMRKMSRRLWHAVHLSSFPLFVLATLHGLTAGTDRHNAILQLAYLLTASQALFMTLVRILAPRRARTARAGV